MSKSSSAENYKQISTYQSLRKMLLQEQFSADLERPLAYWALPGDRRLPLAFLGRTLHDLLNTPFDDLAATPGIGQKKISSLLKLLSRATKKKPSLPPAPSMDGSADRKPLLGRNARAHAEFNPELVSEALWDQWRETVRRQNIGSEKLGRLAPSLQALPTVIWHTPLSAYLDYSMAELRQLKTHGEKRVRVILEIFYTVHEVLANVPPASQLTLRMSPKFVAPLEQWISARIMSDEAISLDSVRASLAIPLVEQIQIDCGQTMARLAEGRLGLNSAPQSVRVQSKRMGVTRARVYQLLEECQQAMAVRWPDGRLQLAQLRQKQESLQSTPDGLNLLRAVSDLFFPDDEELNRRKLEKAKDKEKADKPAA